LDAVRTDTARGKLRSYELVVRAKRYKKIKKTSCREPGGLKKRANHAEEAGFKIPEKEVGGKKMPHADRKSTAKKTKKLKSRQSPREGSKYDGRVNAFLKSGARSGDRREPPINAVE